MNKSVGLNKSVFRGLDKYMHAKSLYHAWLTQFTHSPFLDHNERDNIEERLIRHKKAPYNINAKGTKGTKG